MSFISNIFSSLFGSKPPAPSLPVAPPAPPPTEQVALREQKAGQLVAGAEEDEDEEDVLGYVAPKQRTSAGRDMLGG